MAWAKLRRKRIYLLSLFAYALSTPPGEVTAAPPTSDDLIKEAIDLRRAGRDADALPKFEKAYKLAKSPRAAAQLGLCLQALARWADADPFLAESLSGKDDPWILKNRDIIKDAVEEGKSRVARVEVVGEPNGATVSIYGRKVGILPLPGPVLVNAGTVDIEVSAPGHKSALRTLTLAGASFQPVVIRLEKQANTAPASTPPSLAVRPPHEDTTTDSILTSPADTNQSNPSFLKNPWLWGGGAVLIGAIVVGAVLLSGSARDPMVDGTHDF